MTSVAELLQADTHGVSAPLLHTANEFLATLAQFLKAGGDPDAAELLLQSTALLASGPIAKAQRLRGAVKDMAATEIEPFIAARCFARPKPEEKK